MFGEFLYQVECGKNISNCLFKLYLGHMREENSTFSPPTWPGNEADPSTPTWPGNEADPGKKVAVFNVLPYLNWTKMSVKSRGMPVACRMVTRKLNFFPFTKYSRDGVRVETY